MRKYLNENMEPQSHNEEQMTLDDARRVKVLSPGMLVFKRFIRNKLAIIGLGILIVMFLFAFIGVLFSPYGQTQVFKGQSLMPKDYASAVYNEELRYTVKDGETFDSAARAKFMLAKGKGEIVFESAQDAYTYAAEADNFYRIFKMAPVYEIMLGKYTQIDPSVPLTDELKAGFEAAQKANEAFFTVGDKEFCIQSTGKLQKICSTQEIAIATLNVFDAYAQENGTLVASYAFRLAAETALLKNEKTFTVNGEKYTVSYEGENETVLDASGAEFAEVSDIIVNPLDTAVFLSVDFKATVRQAIADRQDKFEFMSADGQDVEYTLVRVNKTYTVKTESYTELIRMYETPSSEHLLGLDNNGMDNLTRLMYGGQVSLMVGFVVIFIELFIGIIIGGISGYFGGWVDTALMRFVDLFNSIPFYPMVIILGSVMDTLEVSPKARIFLLMIVLGILGWTGVARVVRGQILTLREQDFMIATEATGIRTSRRIFRHLVPNVMPLLIVQATAGLGSIIITEATLGFLGLGVKYPLASWGSIINIASDAHVMTNYWFMWIPAGLLILLTVLGFNFVGDGLRDAFDPKMKR